MKFLTDGMLGKLTRWLRILGYDVEYSKNSDDPELIAAAKKKGRILLTKDFELYRLANSRGIEGFYLQGRTGEEKLAELAERFNIGLDVDMHISRCPKCNTIIEPVPKEAIADKVGKNTFEHYEEFWQCPKCGQVYWKGAHWPGITEKLEKSSEKIKGRKQENKTQLFR